MKYALVQLAGRACFWSCLIYLFFLGVHVFNKFNPTSPLIEMHQHALKENSSMIHVLNFAWQMLSGDWIGERSIAEGTECGVRLKFFRAFVSCILIILFPALFRF